MPAPALAAGTGPNMLRIALAEAELPLPPPGTPFDIDKVAERVQEGDGDGGDGDVDVGGEGMVSRSQMVAANVNSTISGANASLAFSSVPAGPPPATAVATSLATPAFDDRVTLALEQQIQQQLAAEQARIAAIEAARAAEIREQQLPPDRVVAAEPVVHATPDIAGTDSAGIPDSPETAIRTQQPSTATPAPRPRPQPPNPTTPTTPTNPVDPPVDPVDPVDPGDPPVDPVDPVDPPVDPVDPVDPTEPTDPGEEEEEDDCPTDEPCDGTELQLAAAAVNQLRLVTDEQFFAKSISLRTARGSKAAINLRDQKHLDRICLEAFRAGKALPPECRTHLRSSK